MIEIILIIGFIVITYYLSKIALYVKTILAGLGTLADNQRVANAFLTADIEEDYYQRSKKGDSRAKEVLEMVDEIIAKRQDRNQRGEV